MVLRKRAFRPDQLRSAGRVPKGETLRHERAGYRAASLVSRPSRVSSHCRTARNVFWTRRRDDRTQEGETRPEYHHGRNERLVGNGWERRLRRDSYLLPNAAGSLHLRRTARDRDRSLHSRFRRAAGRVSACCHSTLAGRISVAGIRAFRFPVFRNSAPARGVGCSKFYFVFQPYPCLPCRGLFGNRSIWILHLVSRCDVCPPRQNALQEAHVNERCSSDSTRKPLLS